MKKINPGIRQFLDIEAGVDDKYDEDDEDVENDLEDPFIDDEVEPAETHISRRQLRDFNVDDAEDAFDDLISRILVNTTNSRQTARDSPWDQVSWTPAEDVIARQPREGDYPLWKVNCRVGAEDVVALSLMSTAEEHHQVRAAFTRGSIRGSIYIESTMNNDLLNLLKATPGVIRGRYGIRRQMVQPSDYLHTLRMQNAEVDVKMGDWVVVKKGLYKGDVALVARTSSWGARLLLVPRIAYSIRNDGNRKRKASALRPAAAPFDPNVLRALSAKFIDNGGETYSLGMLDFEHGLLAKDFDYHSFKPGASDILFDSFMMFRQSKHPDVVLSQLPRPREWCMKENDLVIIVSSGEPALLKSVKASYAEIERADANQPPGLPVLRWNERVPWYDIKKHVDIGQYIRVSAGPNVGRSGWVVNFTSEIVTFASEMGEAQPVGGNNIEMIDAFINCVEDTEPPAIFSGRSHPTDTDPSLDKAFRHPWCGVNIVITKKQHPRKGETGQIKAVTGQQDGDHWHIKLNVQLTRYNPIAPFQNITVDYDDVVESLTSKELVQYFDPGELFCRPLVKPAEGCKETGFALAGTGDSAVSCTPVPSSVPGAVTPAWDTSSPTPLNSLVPNTPAWDPSSSQTPSRPPIPESPPHSSSSRTPHQPPDKKPTVVIDQTPQHVLLHPNLIDVKLNVTAHGGEFADKDVIVASICRADTVDAHAHAHAHPQQLETHGTLVLRHIRYHTSVLLDPQHITPKHPNPTHDNGLLVVIKGEHCGKYVRRIHHRHMGVCSNGQKKTVVIAAVVIREEGCVDVLTGEQVELDVDFLCTVPEVKKQKDLNCNVMQSVRAGYRKARA